MIFQPAVHYSTANPNEIIHAGGKVPDYPEQAHVSNRAQQAIDRLRSLNPINSFYAEQEKYPQLEQPEPIDRRKNIQYKNVHIAQDGSFRLPSKEPRKLEINAIAGRRLTKIEQPAMPSGRNFLQQDDSMKVVRHDPKMPTAGFVHPEARTKIAPEYSHTGASLA